MQPAYDGKAIMLTGGAALPLGEGDGGSLTIQAGTEPTVCWRKDDTTHRELGPLKIMSARRLELFRLEISGDVYICGNKAGSVPEESLFAFVHTIGIWGTTYPGPGGSFVMTAGPGSKGKRDGMTHLRGGQGELLVAFGPSDELRGPDDEPLTPAEAVDAFRGFLRQVCGI